MKLKSNDVRQVPQPIAIYAVCPEEALAKPGQVAESLKLQAHGFGLLLVDLTGQARELFPAIPLVQVIPQDEFKEKTRGLSGKLRQRVFDAFEQYKRSPVDGVKEISEILEGLVQQATHDAIQRNYVDGSLRNSPIAFILDTFFGESRFQNFRAAIGGSRSYYSEYRNPSSHWPRGRQAAYAKYSECRHAFLDGLVHISRFRQAMKDIGLTGNLPRT
ncbi:MAG: hypothetical protein F4010_01235 [Cenarchaeum sp. SB0669_bin_11]|nr:hypothetical protein [Gammaproteobacteria bacterium]MYL10785.1 hypothetical protein [Cenarchaeum sp. SB0669_bin_11]